MEVQVISSTVQKFDGVSYYRCGEYFQRKGVRLHRTVWEYHNGPIPRGYHVHHKDEDKSNNDIANLVLKEGHDHLREHMSDHSRVDVARKSIEKARKAASEWHGSEGGLAYHSALGKQNWEKREIHTYICTECGTEFQTKHIYNESQNRFCHQNCRARYGHRKRKAAERKGASGAN